MQNFSAVRGFDIKGDAAFVAIDAEEISALAFDKGRSPAATLISGAGRLDLDDIGVHIAEEHRAIRACKSLGQVDHSNVVEHASHSQPEDKASCTSLAEVRKS